MDRVIDTAIHHRWAAESDLHPYLEPDWRGYVGRAGSLPQGAGARRLVPGFRYPNPMGDDLAEAAPPGGGPPGSSYERLAEQVLERDPVEHALLLHDRGMFVAATPNPFLAAAAARAMNEWTVDRWLRRDPRLAGVLLAANQTPDVAAAEIRRLGAHPQITGVLVPAPVMGKMLGHPIYRPVYEAAAELDLTVIVHRGGDALPDTPTGPAGGEPFTFAEYNALAPMALINQVLTMISNGLFESFPALRVLVVGAGVTWIPSALRKMDLVWEALRREVPWVRDPPSEYFCRHVRVSTYGLERHADRGQLERTFDACPQLRTLLCYGSGYPSWDTAGVDVIRDVFPPEWHADILHANARSWFAWPEVPAAAVP